MVGDVAVLISWLTLVGLICQLYLQRTHNEKSLKPLGQIDLEDRQGHLYVQITNNGLGPMIVDRFVFLNDGKKYTAIKECLPLAPQSYTAIEVNESVQKVILPNGHLVIFETRLENSEPDVHLLRQQLSPIRMTVEFHDIYDNRMTIERDFGWFSRYYAEKE